MDLNFFGKQFEEIVGAMSDEDLIRAFAEMGCEVEIDPNAAAWEEFPSASASGNTISHSFSTRHVLVTESKTLIEAADSNELALAA